MENQLQKSNNHSPSTQILNPKENEIAKVVWHVNQLIAYPLSDAQIEAWSKSINSFYSEIEISVLTKLINNFKLGKLEWDYKKGIQNIFIKLREMGIDDDETVRITKENEVYLPIVPRPMVY